MSTQSATGSDLGSRLKQLSDICSNRDWCFSVGSTHLVADTYECCTFPRGIRYPVIVASGDTLYAAVVNCLTRIEHWDRENA